MHACVYVCVGISVCVYKCVFVYACICVFPLLSSLCISPSQVVSLSPYLSQCVFVVSPSQVVSLSPYPSQCVFIVCYSCTRNRSRVCRRPGPVSDSYSQSAETPGDSKIDIRDNLETHTGLCSADPTAIRAQNRIISCECFSLLLINLFF